MRSGIHINASCGGNGACGKCRIKIREGETRASTHPKIAQWEYDEGVRLACMTRPRSDLVVEIPFESQVDRTALKGSSLPTFSWPWMIAWSRDGRLTPRSLKSMSSSLRLPLKTI